MLTKLMVQLWRRDRPLRYVYNYRLPFHSCPVRSTLRSIQDQFHTVFKPSPECPFSSTLTAWLKDKRHSVMNRPLDDLPLWSCAGHALAKYSVVTRFRVREILVVKGLSTLCYCISCAHSVTEHAHGVTACTHHKHLFSISCLFGASRYY